MALVVSFPEGTSAGSRRKASLMVDSDFGQGEQSLERFQKQIKQHPVKGSLNEPRKKNLLLSIILVVEKRDPYNGLL